ncbi:MAG: polyketide synthase, partial [Acidobacteriota bacterium]
VESITDFVEGLLGLADGSGEQAEVEVRAHRAGALDEPIAIIGMGCRYPGADGVDELWELLKAARCTVGDVPAERWDAEAFYDADPSVPGKLVAREGGFVDDLQSFDALFFEISPREAAQVDPRQRAVMEAAWWSLEDAGIPRDRIAETAAGVFMATLTNDFQRLVYSEPERIDAYTGPGTANSIIANRLSYFLDLRGPSLTVDTACSGSLVAIHLACQSLRAGEASLALAGGVSVNLKPESDLFFSKAGALAPDGRCKTFDHRADGIVRSDGAAVVVLKKLSDAVADGDRIHAVIRASGVNQDGRSDGIMAPSGRAQEELLRRVYAHAGVDPGASTYCTSPGS